MTRDREIKRRPRRFQGDRTTLVDRANQILRRAAGDRDHYGESHSELIRALGEEFELAMQLKAADETGLARRLLARINDQAPADWPTRTRARTEYVLCTYKDPALSLSFRLEEALTILGRFWDLATVEDPEVLGLAGAIHRRIWQASGRKENLERASLCYRRGYELGPQVDDGYTGINAAFVADQLARIEERDATAAGSPSGTAAARRAEARAIRVRILECFHTEPAKVDDYWLVATIAEAHFGLDNMDQARVWLARARELSPDPWKLESAASQLMALCRCRVDVESAADLEALEGWSVICEFLDERSPTPETVILGKVGLALSGGGFRASLFHIGVLARLAELDMLRHVEVISCVSGGSIIGAHFYLELQKLLEENADDDLHRKDYIFLVERVASEFLAGVQTNIRVRVGANLIDNLRMLLGLGYSRTHRLGKLYERQLFRRVRDGKENKPRKMSDLVIRPYGHEERFDPRTHNWCRRNKVPTLILNATTLNTGHNWQFTAEWMGESPAAIQTEVDGNERLRRVRYRDAGRHAGVRLGDAVAASSCVPGLFEPLDLHGLYKGRTLRLVDGGVFDNQGTSGLIEQSCDVLLVSDACGQLEVEARPSANILGVLSRSNSLMMERIRGSEYSELEQMRTTRSIRGLLFVHLKDDLEVDPVDWVDCQDPHSASEFARDRTDRGLRTSYNVPKNHQRRLAAIRTDLDTFSEREAFALMESGYRMTAREFPRAIAGIPNEPVEHLWRFHDVSRELDDARDSTRFAQVLNVASGQMFKAWQLSPSLKVLKWGLVLAAGVALGALAYSLMGRQEPLIQVSITGPEILYFAAQFIGLSILAAVIGKLVGTVISRYAMKFVSLRETLQRLAARTFFGVTGFVMAWLHIAVFDRIYHYHGRVERRDSAVDPKPE